MICLKGSTDTRKARLAQLNNELVHSKRADPYALRAVLLVGRWIARLVVLSNPRRPFSSVCCSPLVHVRLFCAGQSRLASFVALAFALGFALLFDFAFAFAFDFAFVVLYRILADQMGS